MMSLLGDIRSAQGETLLGGGWPWKVFVSHGALERLPAVLRDGRLNLPEVLPRYPGMARVSRSDQLRLVPAAQVSQAVWRAETVHLHDMGSCVNGLPQMLAQLERELGLPPDSATMALFASPADGGLALHYDCSDNILIQLAGCKRLTLSAKPALHAAFGQPYNPGMRPGFEMYPQFVDGFPSPQDSSLYTVELEPGTVVYIPRGTWHSSITLTQSLAASVSVTPPSLIEIVVSQLRHLLLQDPRWRTPLYGISGTPAQRAAVAASIQELLPDLQRIAPLLNGSQILDLLLPAAARLQSMGPHSAFQRVPGTDLSVVADQNSPGKALIRLKDGTTPQTVPVTALTIAEGLVPPFRWLIERRPAFCAADVIAQFPEIPAHAIMQLLAGLVRCEALMLLWYPIVPRPPTGQVNWLPAS